MLSVVDPSLPSHSQLELTKNTSSMSDCETCFEMLSSTHD
jgi:hypothetical protein